ncbi:uncharacterized protein LOC131310906 isoform X2 [Rhododendron vialii]|uniref:uncharacterized protein LOC131310906 isoform X2 n=1 Tax=Rhododendron vialii TaxID=182163 RepID=UPI00265EC951|nr:uncharacterized protein LOC131310906 isoform X2 [Rhododendron vialii]
MTDIGGRRQASSSDNSLVEEIDPPSAWTEDSSCHYLYVHVPGFKKEWLNIQVDDRSHIMVGGERQTENKIFRFEQTFKIPENSDTEKISGRYESEILYVIVPKLVKDKEKEPLNAATDDNIRGKQHEHKRDQEEHDEKHRHHQEEHDKKHRHHQEEHDKKHRHHQEEQDERHNHEHDKEEHYGGGHISHHGQNDDDKKVVEEGGFQGVPTATWTLAGGILGSVVDILSKNKGITVTAVLAFALGVLLSQKFQSNAGSEGGLTPM